MCYLNIILIGTIRKILSEKSIYKTAKLKSQKYLMDDDRKLPSGHWLWEPCHLVSDKVTTGYMHSCFCRTMQTDRGRNAYVLKHFTIFSLDLLWTMVFNRHINLKLTELSNFPFEKMAALMGLGPTAISPFSLFLDDQWHTEIFKV